MGWGGVWRDGVGVGGMGEVGGGGAEEDCFHAVQS